MDIEHEFKQKMYVNVLFDPSMLKVLASMVAATLILYALSFQSPECKILIYLTWYVGFIVLLLKERTIVEVTHHMIIVHRPLFHPLIIDKQDIINVQIKKNMNYPFRWLLYALSLILAGYLSYEASFDVLRSISGRTIISGMLLILHELWFIFLLAVVLLGIWKRIPYSNLLKVDTERSYFIFYSQENEKLKRIIEGQDTA